MDSREVRQFVRRAEEFYAAKLQPILEPAHADEFVVIEPESGDFFLGRTLSEAGSAARAAHPNRLTHAMRVGHSTALHFGMNIR
jgi:hypothetical protein